MNTFKFKSLLKSIKDSFLAFSKKSIQDSAEEKILTNLKQSEINDKTFNNLEPFTKNLNAEDEKTFHQLLNKDVFYSKKNKEILNKFHADSKFIFDALQPLLDLNIKFALDITGGAARDFILGKEIKDLDIMLSIPEKTELFSRFSFENLSKIFSKDDLLNSNLFIKNTVTVELNRNNNYKTPEYIFNDYSAETIELLKRFVVSLCFKKHMIELESFLDDKLINYDKDYPVEKHRINCVFKVKHKTNYPIDILLTSLEKAAFLKAFDFDLCKASFCLFINTCTNTMLDPALNFNKGFIEKPEFFISRFSAMNSFCVDVRNKTISYNFYGKNLGVLTDSFVKHLPRIKNKYPDYSVVTIGNNPTLSNAIKIIENEIEFRKEIKPNDNKITKPVNKI